MACLTVALAYYEFVMTRKVSNGDRNAGQKRCTSKKMALKMTVGVWQGVAMDSLKFHPGPPCPTLLRPAGGPPPKRPYSRFGGGPPAERAACGHLLPPWIPLPVRACCLDGRPQGFNFTHISS
jgi:hypothetical protein